MSKKEINDETLKNVSGGELIEEKFDFYMGFIDIFKTVGLTKKDFLKAAKKEWEDNYLKFSTTGSQEDFMLLWINLVMSMILLTYRSL